MQQRLADYVADFLVEKGICDCFTVVGGGAMHLNDAFGHKRGLHCIYNHHEQACAMAADMIQQRGIWNDLQRGSLLGQLAIRNLILQNQLRVCANMR